jgi:hypothetical protein
MQQKEKQITLKRAEEETEKVERAIRRATAKIAGVISAEITSVYLNSCLNRLFRPFLYQIY